jgi:hypothetical protein
MAYEQQAIENDRQRRDGKVLDMILSAYGKGRFGLEMFTVDCDTVQV